MDYVSREEFLLIHSAVIDETGGSHGVRDIRMLESIEALPKQSAFGKEFYPTIWFKAAVYVRNIISSHPFIDGNKRTAMAVADVFLQLNGHKIAIASGGVERFALKIIKDRLELDAIAAWLKRNSKRIRS